MSQETKELLDQAQTQGGWIIAAATGLWGFVLRALVGRHIKLLDKIEDRLDSVDSRLANIEGRMQERDHWE
jgi:hypothetical protein